MPQSHSPDPSLLLVHSLQLPPGWSQFWEWQSGPGTGKKRCPRPGTLQWLQAEWQERLSHDWAGSATGMEFALCGDWGEAPDARGGTGTVGWGRTGIFLPAAVHSEADSALSVFQSANPFACVGDTETFWGSVEMEVAHLFQGQGTGPTLPSGEHPPVTPCWLSTPGEGWGNATLHLRTLYFF